MDKYESRPATLNAGEIEEMVMRYLEKTLAEALAGKTTEKQKIIDRIIEQATF